MKETISLERFCDGFPDSYKDNFSYDGKCALYDYFEQLESDLDSEIEYDPIAFCCEYTEYENLKELQKDYNVDSMEELEYNTRVIKIEDSERFIIHCY